MTSGCRGEAGERGGDKALEHNEDVMGGGEERGRGAVYEEIVCEDCYLCIRCLEEHPAIFADLPSFLRAGGGGAGGGGGGGGETTNQ
jgi:hypothetical protein